jgi:tape measure domain-containing protein
MEEGDHRMSSVDNRIVNMQFNNKQFTAGVAESQRSLTGLEQSLAKTGGSAGLTQMASNVDQATSRFSALKVAGVTAIATIANKVTNFGIDMAKSLTLDPIAEGFSNYETKINAVQTILSNTKDQGTNLKIVTKNLNELNKYANLTVYNFSEMARNIGTFTAAGVDLKTSVSSIKGIANLAALSGSTSQQASSAMYQLSQAIAAGQVHLQDWNSVVNAGIGGAVFQKNLIQAALATGSLDKSQVHLGKTMADTTVNGLSFRQSLTPPPGGTSWLTSKALTTSLGTFTGDMTKAQLVAEGFPKAVAKAIAAQGKMAVNAATQVKTFSQLFQALKEEVGTAWAAVFEALFGNIKQAKAFLSPLHTAIENFLTKPIYELAGIIKGFRIAGGFTDLKNIFMNLATAVGNLLYPFKAIFVSLFPNAGKSIQGAGSGLEKFTKLLVTLTGWIAHATEFTHNYSDTFAEMGGRIRTGLDYITSLIGQFSKLGPVIEQALGPLKNLGQEMMNIGANIVNGIIGGISGSDMEKAVVTFAQNIITWIEGALGIHSPAAEMIPVGFNIAAGIAEGLIKGVSVVIQGFGVVLKAIFSAVGQLFSGFTATDFASLFNAALTGGLIFAIKKMVDTITSLGGSFEAIGKGFAESLDQIGKSLQAWQNSLKAKMIEEIAIAIGILVASLVVLSLLDPEKLAIGLTAITGMLALLTATLSSLSKIESDKQMAILATSLLLISAAMIQFAGAILILGKQDMGTLAKGMGAMAFILSMLVDSVSALSGMEGQFVSASTGMTLMAVAINIMAGAIALLGNMDMSTLAKGIAAMGFGLSLMVGSLEAMAEGGPSMLAGAAGMVLMAGALTIMSVAISKLGNMKLSTLTKGLIAMGIGLSLMVGSLEALAVGGPSILAGAAGMVLMATAMNMMVGVIMTLGTAPWQTVAKGLGFVAAALAIFLLAGLGAIFVAPGLEALGTAVLLLGAGMFLAGAGMAAFGTGFALLAATGVAGTAVLIAAIHAFLALLPEIAVQIAAAVIAFIKVFANASTELRKVFDTIFRNIIGVIQDNIPVLAKLGVTMINQLLKSLTRVIPQFGKLISVMIRTGLDVLTKAVPQYINAGVTIILRVLEGMRRNVPKIVNTAGDLIVAFINAVAKQDSHIINAAAHAILTFLRGLDKAITKNEQPIIHEGELIALHIGEGIVQGLGGAAVWNMVKQAAENLAGSLPGWMKKVLGIDSPAKAMIPIGVAVGEGVAKGIEQSHSALIRSVAHMADVIISEGDKQVLKAQKHARALQNKAYTAQARADIKADEARNAAQFARQHKKDKEAQKRAKAVQKQADAAQKHADAVQKAADRGATHVQNVQAFQQADLHGKGDIRNEAAVALADRSNKIMAKANAEAARANELMKTNVKAGRAMLAQSRKDARDAKKLAEQARKAHKDAQKYYAREVDVRIKQLEKDAAADEKAKKDQAAFDAADAQGQSDILTKRAEAEHARAKAQHKLAQQLIKQAKRLADTDAAKSMKLLDRAEKAAQASKDAADQAKQDKDQAQQILDDQASGVTPDTTGGPTIEPSRTVLEDAAKAIDRYTASLLQATEQAAAAQGTIQFNQNNYSPEALSVSEVYRQSKNLLSAAELKMGVTKVP